MTNMFENTLDDLRDCLDAMEYMSASDLMDDNIIQLVKVCKEIADNHYTTILEQESE